ncbi:Prophage integrase IntS [Achromobacter veterisilvae]|uniref:Prophage integrase IntS n=1 Tax=Achromobacter veterisilvae TaxID=2069367 RepID=A0A446CFK6_9BURK|nr:Prophage integrase IntS [Achromobacter veterisilvae]
MPLTDTAIRQAKATDKPRKLADGGGLYLLINLQGKYWRWDYRHAGKRKTMALGLYPDVSLSQARDGHANARALLAAGTDPMRAKRDDRRALLQASANSFEAVARAWMAERASLVAEDQNKKTLARMENDAFPWLGNRALTDIDAPDVLAALKRVDGRGARYTAHRLRSETSRVFRYGIKQGLCKTDPARDLIGAIPQPVERHFAAITNPPEVGEMLRAFDAFSGTFPVLCALKLAPMLFVRPGKLRTAEWADIDLEKGE